MVNFDEYLTNLENDGYTVIAVLPDDDNPYSKFVVVEDSNGNKSTKHVILTGYTDIKDDNGNLTGVDEDWEEV